MLPAPHRLTSGADFASVIRGPGGARAGSRLLVVHVAMTDSRVGMPPRVGLVVSKAVGGAVVRNRTARRLRALMATRLGDIPAGTDIVLRAQPAAGGATSAELAEVLDPLLHKAFRRCSRSRESS